jgi:hypothetical protein
MTTRNGELRGDSVLAIAIAGGATYDEAAAAANVSARTVSRRMADPGFAGGSGKPAPSS